MWGESWGTMIWGGASQVPVLSPLGLLGLGIALGALGAFAARRIRRRRGVPLAVLMLALAVPLTAAAALVVPFTFVNGTVADANEVNANFEAVETAINELQSSFVALSEADFQARNGQQNVIRVIGNGGAWIQSASDSRLVATARVPGGATITGIEFWFEDTDVVNDLELCLARNNNFGAYVALGCVQPSTSAGRQSVTLNTFASNNGVGFLEIWATSKAGAAFIAWPGSSLRIAGAYLNYEL